MSKNIPINSIQKDKFDEDKRNNKQADTDRRCYRSVED